MTTEPVDRRSGGEKRRPKEVHEHQTVEQASPAPAPQPPSMAEDAGVPADFLQLAHMLFIQAMITLGEIPNPATGQAEIDLRLAKAQIGFLEMLQEKTKGNLSETESKYLSECLHQAHLTYVMVSKTAKKTT